MIPLLAALMMLAGPSVSGPAARVVFWANVEGASHTAAAGNDAGRASGVARMDLMTRVITARHADVGVLNELERPQAAEFRARVGHTFALVYPRRDTRNSVFYRRSAFTLIARGYRVVPYFAGHRHRIPVAWLRDRATGRILVILAVHNPADTRRFPHQARWRARALAIEIAAVNRLAAAHPRIGLVLAGDFNARRTALDAVTRRTVLASPIPAGWRVPIDQAFTARLGVAGYHRWSGPAIVRATDHRAVYSLTYR